MIDFTDYFDPPVIELDRQLRHLGSEYLFRQIKRKFAPDDDWRDVSIAIIGISDGCNSFGNEGCGQAPDVIRKELYKLAGFENGINIVDLGNIKGVDVRNRIVALEEIIPVLINAGIVVLVLGGSHDYLHALAHIVANHEPVVMAIADSHIDWDFQGDDYTSESFVKPMVAELKDNLEHCFFMGTQRYFVPKRIENEMDHNIFEYMRLANIRGEAIRNVEPALRDSNVFGADVSVVRSIDMPAQKCAMPNGLSAPDFCQMARYAGLSDKMKVAGFFEFNPSRDSVNQAGAALMAQAVWYFCEGVGHRYFDYPFCSLDHYDTFVVWMEDFELEITFYRNSMNDRWWVKIPQSGQDVILSCSEEDYQKASRNEFPDRWYKAVLRAYK